MHTYTGMQTCTRTHTHTHTHSNWVENNFSVQLCKHFDKGGLYCSLNIFWVLYSSLRCFLTKLRVSDFLGNLKFVLDIDDVIQNCKPDLICLEWSTAPFTLFSNSHKKRAALGCACQNGNILLTAQQYLVWKVWAVFTIFHFSLLFLFHHSS